MRRWDNREYWGTQDERGYSFYANGEIASATISHINGDTSRGNVALLWRDEDGSRVAFVDNLPIREALILARGFVRRGSK